MFNNTYLSPTRFDWIYVRVLRVGIKEAFKGLVHYVSGQGTTGLIGLVISESPLVRRRNRGGESMLLVLAFPFFRGRGQRGQAR